MSTLAPRDILALVGLEARGRTEVDEAMTVPLHRMILLAALPFLIGAYDGKEGRSCGAICDDLAGAWSVTVAPPPSVLVKCTDRRMDGTPVPFPAEAIGLGEVRVAPASSGAHVEFRSAAAPIRITGSLDPATFVINFELRDGRGKGIRCKGPLKKFTNPAGSEGWVVETACESGVAKTAQCRLDPPVKATLLVQRILMEGPPSR